MRLNVNEKTDFHIVCKENNIEIYYLVDKKNISYIKNDIIYKDKIFTDLNDILIFIRKQKNE